MEVKTRNNLSVSPDSPLWPAKLKRTPIYLSIPPINNQRKGGGVPSRPQKLCNHQPLKWCLI